MRTLTQGHKPHLNVGTIGHIDHGKTTLTTAILAVPGDNVNFTVELNKPVAIQPGTRFAIREGGRTIGSGVVSEVLD